VLGPGDAGDLFQLVAAIIDRRRALEILALVVERLLVEAFEQQLELLLEIVAVGRGIE
jgi:hypothetical protein